MEPLLFGLVREQFACDEDHHPADAGPKTAEVGGKEKTDITNWFINHQRISLKRSPELPAETKRPDREFKAIS